MVAGNKHTQTSSVRADHTQDGRVHHHAQSTDREKQYVMMALTSVYRGEGMAMAAARPSDVDKSGGGSMLANTLATSLP